MMVSYAIVFSKLLSIVFSYTIISELFFFVCVGHLTEGNYNCTSLGEEEELLKQVYMEEDIQEEAADVLMTDKLLM
jgi:hypothetical protein